MAYPIGMNNRYREYHERDHNERGFEVAEQWRRWGSFRRPQQPNKYFGHLRYKLEGHTTKPLFPTVYSAKARSPLIAKGGPGSDFEIVFQYVVGTHDELFGRKGRYATMWRKQVKAQEAAQKAKALNDKADRLRSICD